MSCVCDHVASNAVDALFVVGHPLHRVDPSLMVLVSAPGPTENDAIDSRWVEMVGQLDAYTAGCIAARMGRVDKGAGVVLDLRGVSFIDSAGLRCLEVFLDGVVEHGGGVWLHAPSRVVRRLLGILDVDRFEICEPISPYRSLHHACLSSFSTSATRRTDATLPIEVERGLTIDTAVATSITDRCAGRSPGRNDVVYTVRGEFDVVAARRIAGNGMSCLERVGVVTVDLAGVTIIDSAGVRLIEQLAGHVDAVGGRLVVRAPSSIVRCVLDALDVSFDIDSNGPRRLGDEPQQ